MKKEQTLQINDSKEEVYSYLLQLIRSCLNEEPVPEKPESVSWAQLFAESKRQSVLLLAYDSIKKLQIKPDGEIGEKWRQWHDKLLTKGVNQTVTIENLLNEFHENRIKTIPMKGFYIRKTYPVCELREMTDLDLLIESDCSGRARSLMLEKGYSVTEDHEVHTSFSKPPYLMVELHKKLLPEYVGHGDYYENIWEKSVPEEERPYICHLSPSDTFIHLMLHFYKHYFKSCCGIRFAIDFFTYSRYYGQQLDWTYIWNEFEKLKIRGTAEDVLGVGQAWFGDGTMTERQKKMAHMMCSSGTYGTARGYDYNQILKLTPKSGNVKIGKLRYFLRIVFPPIEEMKLEYPVLEKAPIFLPFTWIARGIRTIFRNPKHISKYYNRAKNAIPESKE